jgi:hypothetical protein
MKLLIILFLSLSLYADVKQEMFHLYQNKNFSAACVKGLNAFSANKDDEEFLSMYSFSCLYSDYIDRLAVPITMMKHSKEARANAAYFSVILMQKKLLFHALLDNYNLSSLKLPTTDYILSKIFDLYSKLGQHEPKAYYLFQDKDDKKITYKLYILKSENKNSDKVVLEEFYDTMSVNRHVYW